MKDEIKGRFVNIKRIVLNFSDNKIFINIFSVIVRMIGRTINKRVSLKILYIISRVLFASPGMLFIKAGGHYHAHVDKFFYSVKRLAYKTKEIPKRKNNFNERNMLKIGVIGMFGGITVYSKKFFEGFPDSCELFVFDIQLPNGSHAKWLEDRYTNYNLIFTYSGKSKSANYSKSRYEEELDISSKLINESKIDILAIMTHGDLVYDIIDLIDTPCIVNVSAGSDVVHHSKVDIELCAQFQYDLYLKNNRLFCAITDKQFVHSKVYKSKFFYDLRGIEYENSLTWNEKENLIVFHGSLYKLGKKELLNAVFSILKSDKNLRFIYIGKNNFDEISLIKKEAEKMDISGQVEYGGEYQLAYDAQGNIIGKGWERVRDILTKAKVSINPWPIGGGCAVFEAYASGTPCITMAKTATNNIRRGNYILYAGGFLPALHIEQATAYSIKDYMEKCKKCIYNESFAKEIILRQKEIAKEVNDSNRWWNELILNYNDWFKSNTNKEEN